MQLEDIPDEDDFCRVCGATLPHDQLYGIRKYCSRKCRKRAPNRLGKEGRTCQQCGGPIPVRRDSKSKFCSYRCRDRHFAQLQSEDNRIIRRAERAAADRPCAECGGQLSPDSPWGTRFCCRACNVRYHNRRRSTS